MKNNNNKYSQSVTITNNGLPLWKEVIEKQTNKPIYEEYNYLMFNGEIIFHI